MEIGLTFILWSAILALVIGHGLRKYLKFRQWCSKYDSIPGPSSVPILGNAFQIAANRDDVVKKVYERFDKYGPIFYLRMGYKHIVNLSRPEDIEVLLNSKKHIEKSYVYKYLVSWLGDGLLLSKGAKWHAHRKLITPAFHFKILESFQEVFNAKSDILVNKLEKYTDIPIDIFSFISRATLDVICETAMGANINAQGDKQSDYGKSIYDISALILHRIRRLWLYSNFIYSLTKYGKSFKKCLTTLHDFTGKVIQDRKSQKKVTKTNDCSDDVGIKKRVAFLDVLLEAAENGFNINETSIREEVDTFMFAGHDTTATGISWTLFLLGHNPEHQELAYQELNAIFNGEDRPITIDDLNEMKYLERVIKESLRIYPPAPAVGRVLDEDTQIDKYIIPAGTSINIVIHRVHRDPRYFPDPEKYDPDRFLPENCKERHPFAYIPFSAGSRNCIGQKFAMMEEKVILASILRKYKITSIDKREDLHLLFELILKATEGFKIKLEKRN